MSFTLAGKRVYVAGHRGMVGSALVRRLQGEGCEILTAGRAELDLRRQAEVEAWFGRARPQVVLPPRRRSAASSPTTDSRPNSSTTTS